MYGAIIGDICGSLYEFNNFKTDTPSEIPIPANVPVSDCSFSGNTVQICAMMDALLTRRNYKKALRRWANKYPNCGYDSNFVYWFSSRFPKPYRSLDNSAAMRAVAIGRAVFPPAKASIEAKRSTEVTHTHEESIKSAQAIATAATWAYAECSKKNIKYYLENNFDYNFQRTLKDIRQGYAYSKDCQATVPEAIIAFLESENYTSAIQNAISLGGDSSTLACITGGIAELYYEDTDNIPDNLFAYANRILPAEMITLLNKFYKKYYFNISFRGML